MKGTLIIKKRSTKDSLLKTPSLAKLFDQKFKKIKQDMPKIFSSDKKQKLEKNPSLLINIEEEFSYSKEENFFIFLLFLPFKMSILSKEKEVFENFEDKINIEDLFCQETQISYYVYNSSKKNKNFIFVGFICFEEKDEDFIIKEKSNIEEIFMRKYSTFPIFLLKEKSKLILGFIDLFRNLEFINKEEYEDCNYLNQIWNDIKYLNEIFTNNFIEKFGKNTKNSFIIIVDICLIFSSELIIKNNKYYKISSHFNLPFPHFENFRKLPFFENFLDNIVLSYLLIFQDYEVLKFIYFFFHFFFFLFF